MKQQNSCSTGTWIDLITAALINTNYLHICMDAVVLDIKGVSCFYRTVDCLRVHHSASPAACRKVNAYYCCMLNACGGVGMQNGQRGALWKRKHWWKQRTALTADHILQESTFISTSRTVNRLFWLNPRPIQQPHQLFYKPNEWDPNTYLPQWLVDKCTNKNGGWSLFPTLTPNVTGFCSRNRFLTWFLNHPWWIYMQVFPDYSTFL